MTICVLGASGFVGATLVERLLANGQHSVKPVIRTAGNAWRLARRGIHLEHADVGDPDSLDEVMRGADYVVNCAMIPPPLIVKGTEALVSACERHQVRRLVHLSSVAVYGEPPSPDSVSETAAPRTVKGTYGYFKDRQDQIIGSAVEAGRISAHILCVPNISGIYSRYLLELVSAIGAERFALVEGGTLPVMLCDVQNVAQAIELTLNSPHTDGKRTFVMDGEPTTWRQLAEHLAPLAGRSLPLPTLSRAAALAVLEGGPRGVRGALGTLKQVVAQPGVKQAVKRNASLAQSYLKWRARLGTLPPAWRSRTAAWASSGQQSPPAGPATTPLEPRFLQHQLREVRHSTAKASTTLGYVPEVSFEQSMRAFFKWYRTLHGLDGPSATLIRELDQELWFSPVD